MIQMLGRTTTRENDASGSECSSGSGDERDGRKRKRGRKRRTFSSKSPTRRREEKRKKEEDEKKTTDVENTVKYGYQPRAPNANGKQSVPKHPQSIVAATHLSKFRRTKTYRCRIQIPPRNNGKCTSGTSHQKWTRKH